MEAAWFPSGSILETSLVLLTARFLLMLPSWVEQPQKHMKLINKVQSFTVSPSKKSFGHKRQLNAASSFLYFCPKRPHSFEGPLLSGITEPGGSLESAHAKIVVTKFENRSLARS